MSESNRIKIEIQAGNMKHSAEGPPEEVLRQVIQFVTKIHPTYELASKLVYAPDLADIFSDISDFVKITPDGRIVMAAEDLPADEAIGYTLIAGQAAQLMTGRQSGYLSAEEISSIIGKALKTVRNILSEMTKSGRIQRGQRGTYAVGPSGLMHYSQLARSRRKSIMST